MGTLLRERLSTLKRAVLLMTVTFLVAASYAMAIQAQPAFAADKQLKVGEYYALPGVPNSWDFGDDLLSLRAKSSDTSVVSCKAAKPDGYEGSRELFAHARGFGKATVTVEWKVRERVVDEKTGKIKAKAVKHQRCFDASVEDARIKKANCDELFAGRSYSVSNLFKLTRSKNHVPYLPKQGKGTFREGNSYKVVSNGKKVEFSAGCKDVTLRYVFDGKEHAIDVATVHDAETLKDKAITSMKKSAYIPSSVKLKSVSFSNGKLNLKFTMTNLVGTISTCKMRAYYKGGIAQFDKLA